MSNPEIRCAGVYCNCGFMHPSFEDWCDCQLALVPRTLEPWWRIMSNEKHELGDKQVRIVHDLVPADWDNGPLSLAHELRNMLKSVVDQGTGIDSGGGDGCADVWATISGVEYRIAITRSNAQVQQDEPRRRSLYQALLEFIGRVGIGAFRRQRGS